MPSTNYTSHAGHKQPPIHKFWYTGSDALTEGQVLCYNQDATIDDTKTGRGQAVEKPTTNSLAAFAGIVTAEGAKTGPGWVRCYVPMPNTFCKAMCKANATTWATALAPANNSYSLAAHSDSTLNLNMVAIFADDTHDSSVTDALKLIMFK